MKICPFCAEEIQDAAIKCKHCGEMLGSLPAVVVAESSPLAPVSTKLPRADALVESRLSQTDTTVKREWSTPADPNAARGCVGGCFSVFLGGAVWMVAASAHSDAAAGIGFLAAIVGGVIAFVAPEQPKQPAVVIGAEADCPRCGTHVVARAGIVSANLTRCLCIGCQSRLDLTGPNAVKAD